MSQNLSRAALSVGLLAVLVAALRADETSDKQMKVAEANLTKAEVKTFAVVESEHLILGSPLPAARGKAVADVLQKSFQTARKGLQYEDKEEPWKGKLTIYHLPNKSEYGSFLRLIAGQRPDVSSYYSVRGDEPYAVGSASLGDKTTDADVGAELAPLVGGALLMSKVGPSATVPPWVRTGFGRAAAVRAEGTTGKRFNAYKTQARAVVSNRIKPVAVIDIWSGDRDDTDLLATSLMDYLAYGSGIVNFPRFLSSLRPDENGDTPAIAMAFESAGWKLPELDAAWKKWVSAGMVEGKLPPKK